MPSGLAAQFGAKFLFNRGEIGVEIDKQPIDRRIDHLYPTSRSYCSGVSKRSTLPRPAMMACSTACLEARSRNPLPRRIISIMLSGFVKVRGSGPSAEILLHESAMPSLSKNEGHMDAAEFQSRCALGCTRIAGSLARRLPEHSVKIAPAKAADLSCQPHPSCRTALAAHA